MMSLEYPRPGLHGENEKASKRGKETVMPMAELTENWRQLARGLSKDPEKQLHSRTNYRTLGNANSRRPVDDRGQTLLCRMARPRRKADKSCVIDSRTSLWVKVKTPGAHPVSIAGSWPESNRVHDLTFH
jgi:hypothetical protein